MYYKLDSKIVVGAFKFDRVNSVQIVEDLDKIGTVATLKVPNTAVLIRQGKYRSEIETQKEIKVGDKVRIDLGYNGDLRTEFEGFVRAIQVGTPLSIECEDAIYILKRKNLKKAFKSVSLKALLRYILEGTGITLANEPPVIEFGTFYLRDVTAAAALEKLKSEYGLTITTVGLTKLYVGLWSKTDDTVVKYSFGDNIIDANLEYVNEADVRIEVKAIHIRKNNTKVEKTFGDKNGEKRTLYFYNLPKGSDLETVAKEELKRIKYTGLKGSFKGFLTPNAHAGNVIHFRDKQYNKRVGSYLCHKMELTFDEGGGRRKIDIGIKLNQ
jgi:hypothetical protein